MVHDFHSYVKEPEGIWDLFFDGKLILILKIPIDFFDGLLGRSINAGLFFWENHL
jgi:hypothetical protein